MQFTTLVSFINTMCIYIRVLILTNLHCTITISLGGGAEEKNRSNKNLVMSFEVRLFKHGFEINYSGIAHYRFKTSL